MTQRKVLLEDDGSGHQGYDELDATDIPSIANITGNAATVTTNANLTGDVTSSGNATTIGAGKVTEAMQVLADNTTQNVSTSKHGYAPKSPNDATKYLDGTGAYSVPAAALTYIGCRAYNSTTQNIPSATGPVLTFDTEDFDTNGFHSTSSNTSRMTIPANLGGKYLLVGGTHFAASASGTYRILAFTKNGATIGPHMRRGTSPSDPAFTITAIVSLVPTDYVEMIAYQDGSGGVLVGDASTTEFQTTFAITFLGA